MGIARDGLESKSLTLSGAGLGQGARAVLHVNIVLSEFRNAFRATPGMLWGTVDDDLIAEIGCL